MKRWKKTPDILLWPPHVCAYVHTEIHITYNAHRHTFAHAEVCQNSGTITDVWPSTYQIRNKLFWQCFPLNYSKHHCPKDFLFFFSKIAWKSSEKQIPTLHSCLACDPIMRLWLNAGHLHSTLSVAKLLIQNMTISYLFTHLFFSSEAGSHSVCLANIRTALKLAVTPATSSYLSWNYRQVLHLANYSPTEDDATKKSRRDARRHWRSVFLLFCPPIQHSFDGTKSGRDSDVTLRVK